MKPYEIAPLKSSRLIAFLTAALLVISTCTFFTADAYGSSAKYPAGSTIAAKQTPNMAKNLGIDHLDITWLDFGSDMADVAGPAYYGNDCEKGYFSMAAAVDGYTESFLIDHTGKVVINAGYLRYGAFSDGLAIVETDDPPLPVGQVVTKAPVMLSGVIDLAGDEVIPLGKYRIPDDMFREGLVRYEVPAAGSADEELTYKGYLNKAGEIAIGAKYTDAQPFSEGLASVQDPVTRLYGYIDKTGKQVIPMEYEYADNFSEGYAQVADENESFFIDKNGNRSITLPQGFQPYYSFEGGLARVTDDAGNIGYVDKTGELVIDAEYKSAGPFSGDVTYVEPQQESNLNTHYENRYRQSFCYLIDKTGERITPLNTYAASQQDIVGMQNDLIVLIRDPHTNPKYGALNKYGSEIVPFVFDGMTYFNEQGYALVTLLSDNGESTLYGILKKPTNALQNKGNGMITVTIDGNRLDFTDVDPFIENGRTLVPMRAIFEALGAKVEWNETDRTVTGEKDGTTVQLTIDSTAAKVGDLEVTLDVSAKIHQDRTMVPIRFISESFKNTVTWDADTKTVIIKTN